MNTGPKPKHACKACGKQVAHGHFGPLPHKCERCKKVCALGQAGAKSVTAHEKTNWCQGHGLDIKTGRAEGKRAARYFGAEYWCNRETSSRLEYLESVAAYYGHKTFAEMPDELKKEARAEFEAGIRDEKKA